MYTLPDTACREDFQKQLLDWFTHNMRPLPWRTHYTPYEVWISEIMLQQTQMERGVTYFQRWMRHLPDILSVAHASEEEILRLWEGLGYYSRARNLHKAAQTICQKHHGTFPSHVEDIRLLPGIGPYTAAAIASIAFQEDIPCIDANVERVLARCFDIDVPVKQEQARKHIEALSSVLLPTGKAREYNQAMMELGALICNKSPRCPKCPLAHLCQSLRLNIVSERPVAAQKATIHQAQAVTGILYVADHIFIQKRLPKGIWGNLWEFPGGRIEADESPEEAICREFKEETGFEVGITNKLTVIRHSYTNYRITLHCFSLTLSTPPLQSVQNSISPQSAQNTPPTPPILEAATEYRWETLSGLSAYAMPAAHRKLADTLTNTPLLHERAEK